MIIIILYYFCCCYCCCVVVIIELVKLVYWAVQIYNLLEHKYKLNEVGPIEQYIMIIIFIEFVLECELKGKIQAKEMAGRKVHPFN